MYFQGTKNNSADELCRCQRTTVDLCFAHVLRADFLITQQIKLEQDQNVFNERRTDVQLMIVGEKKKSLDSFEKFDLVFTLF